MLESDAVDELALAVYFVLGAFIHYGASANLMQVEAFHLEQIELLEAIDETFEE